MTTKKFEKKFEQLEILSLPDILPMGAEGSEDLPNLPGPPFSEFCLKATGCPKEVHKFEIKNLYSEIRSISKVVVICQTSRQLTF